MTTSGPRRARPRTRLLYVPLLSCAALLAPMAATGAYASPSAVAANRQPPTLMRAGRAVNAADRALVADARRLQRCLGTHPGHCARARHALQRAGARLAASERRLTSLAHGGAQAAAGAWQGQREAPRVSVSGDTLSWPRVAGMNTYVFVRKVPGQADQYSIIAGTSITPPAVPGATVRYSVRTTARWSAWAAERAISYPRAAEVPHTPPTPTVPGAPGAPGTPEPPATPEKPGTPEKPSTPNTEAAPTITVSGHTLSWNAIAGVNTYVFVRKVPGQSDAYSVLSGTTATPAAAAGKTVRYSVRTAVTHSAWATEVSIAYPAETPPPPPPEEKKPPVEEKTPPVEEKSPPVEEPAPPVEELPRPSEGAFEMGAVVGSNAMYELPWLKALGAHTARMEFGINSSVASLEPVVAAYAAAGIRPLMVAGFNARIPSVAEAQNVAKWASAFGPGGTFWKGKNYAASTAITTIEFGNETNNPWQYLGTTPSNWANEPAFLARAEEYARLLKAAQIAISQAGANVGLLGIADQYSGYTTWVNAMFKAVPDLGQRVAGWTVHPYGPNWKTPIDTLIADTAAHGAPSTVPIYATEWGVSTDNGRCLDDNFGWNKCMSYQEAASVLSSTVGAMRARYGSRLRSVYIFQARDQQPTGASSNREYYFGALQSNQASKGAYTTEVQSLLAENP